MKIKTLVEKVNFQSKFIKVEEDSCEKKKYI